MKLTWKQSQELRALVKRVLNRAEEGLNCSSREEDRAFYARIVTERRQLLAAMGSERVELETTPDEREEED